MESAADTDLEWVQRLTMKASDIEGGAKPTVMADGRRERDKCSGQYWIHSFRKEDFS